MKVKIVGNNKLSPQEKKKWLAAQKKAHETYKQAILFTKYKLGKKDYRCLDFKSKKGYEYVGIVDLVAIKRHRNNKNQLDNLEIVLFQVKGGKSKLDEEEIARLKEAVKNVKITWNTAEKRGQTVSFGKKM